MPLNFKSKSLDHDLFFEASNITELPHDNNDNRMNAKEKDSIIDIEVANNSIWREEKTFHVALVSTFSALSVVLGYMLAYIPNIELFTLFIFMSGFVLSKRDGFLIGLLSSSIFTFFNPLGASPPPLFVYQLIHYSLTGFLGGLIKDFLIKKTYFKPKEDLYVFQVMILFGIIGGTITFIYDILSTLIGGFLVSMTIEYFLTSYLTGIIFTLIHLVGNILGFVFILPGLIQLIIRLID